MRERHVHHDGGATGPKTWLRVMAGAGSLRSVVAGAGSSVSTSRAGLSSRRALNAACRSRPSAVKPSYSISATNTGRTQWIPPAFAARFCQEKGSWRSPARLQLRKDAGDLVPAESGPDPTYLDQLAVAIHACNQLAEGAVSRRVQPIITSWPARHLDLVQVSTRSEL
jgi:hypothetical protein